MEDSQNQNLEPNNFTQPQTPKPKKLVPTWLGFVTIIIFAIITFGGAFAYQYFVKFQIPITNDQQNLNVQNPTTETAGWKTYTNSKYGFEFKYPADWKAVNYTPQTIIWSGNLQNSDNVLALCNQKSSVPCAEFHVGISGNIIIYPKRNIAQKNLDDIKTEAINSLKNYTYLIEIQDITINSQKGFEKVWINYDPIYPETYLSNSYSEIFTTPEFIYIIDLTGTTKEMVLNKKILSTFEFTK